MSNWDLTGWIILAAILVFFFVSWLTSDIRQRIDGLEARVSRLENPGENGDEEP